MLNMEEVWLTIYRPFLRFAAFIVASWYE